MSFWSALGAGISGLLGMGSSAMNAASQNQANKYNLQAQRETNQANMAINQSQLDYAQKMYQDQVAQQWKMFNTSTFLLPSVKSFRRLSLDTVLFHAQSHYPIEIRAYTVGKGCTKGFRHIQNNGGINDVETKGREKLYIAYH